jgi:phospholipase/carboxylesterase
MLYPDLILPRLRPAEGFYTSEVLTPRVLPVRTFLPTGYEPGYSYPLLIFFHGHGGDEKQILRLAPRLSRRNFVCISLRGLRPVEHLATGKHGYTWGGDDVTDVLVEDYVFRALELTSETYNIHPGRVYLAGVCEGAALAYRLGLSYPERFSGVISLNGTMTRQGRPLSRLPEVRKLRVLIGHGIANAVVPLSLARDDFRLLYTAGLSVEMYSYPTTHRLHADMLRDINRWVIGHCYQGQTPEYAR